MTLLSELRAKLDPRRIGYTIDEVMTGTHQFEPGFGPAGRRFMEFRVTWGSERALGTLDPRSDGFLVHDLVGTVTVDGLCRAAPCEGHLELRYFADQRIRYVFEFSAAGNAYRYVGEKVNILPWNLAWSHTTCFGRLTEVATGKLVSTSVTHFRLRTMPAFLKSFRLHAA